MRNVGDREIRSRLREFMEFAAPSARFRLTAEIPIGRVRDILEGGPMTNAERVVIYEHASIAQWEIKQDWTAWLAIGASTLLIHAAFAVLWVFELPVRLWRRATQRE